MLHMYLEIHAKRNLPTFCTLFYIHTYYIAQCICKLVLYSITYNMMTFEKA